MCNRTISIQSKHIPESYRSETVTVGICHVRLFIIINSTYCVHSPSGVPLSSTTKSLKDTMVRFCFIGMFQSRMSWPHAQEEGRGSFISMYPRASCSVSQHCSQHKIQPSTTHMFTLFYRLLLGNLSGNDASGLVSAAEHEPRNRTDHPAVLSWSKSRLWPLPHDL